jgi:hypothetical protein
MKEEKRHNVSLTESEISGLIVTVGQVRIMDVHPCRIKQTHSALQELRDAQREIEIERGE